MKIKFIFLTAALLVTLVNSAISQSGFTHGTTLINGGTGFGNLYYAGYGGGVGYNFSSDPALIVNVDYAFKRAEEVHGVLGIGGLIGYQNSSVNFNDASSDYYYKQNWDNYIIAFRGTYHPNFPHSDKWDFYGGFMMGLRIEEYTFSSNSSYYTSLYRGSYGGVTVTTGIFMGGTYYFANNIGAFAELGYDVSYLKVGLSLKTGSGQKYR